MEIDYNKESSAQSGDSSESKEAVIKVRAIISCPSCGYVRKFRNQFPRNQLELFVVSAKVFEFMTCSCGELLNLKLEFEI